MIFSPFLGAFHSFDSAIVEKTTKRPEGGREGGKEGERERGGQAIAVLVIRSAGAGREKGLPRQRRRPIMQNGPRLLLSHSSLHREREREREREENGIGRAVTSMPLPSNPIN